MSSCTIYIDESGDEGIKRIATESTLGSSPWFTLGAFLINDSFYDEVKKKLDEIKKKISKKNIHFSQLSHEQKIFVCQEIAKLPIVAFGLISNKKSLGSYSI